ncbi:radical SAM protein [Vibrio vulnificus]|nr:radical SAM protein [Vibrio vulnificus]HAS8118909.1 radical SAM protein [Vibrio vulnificus]
MNKSSRILKKQIQVGYWPGFIVGMYPSMFAYKPIPIDIKKSWKGVKEVNLYFHIPFCKWDCSFCTFFKVVKSEKSYFEKYTDKLIEQIHYYDEILPKGTIVKSICFGGGTPNAIPADHYKLIFNALNESSFVFDDSLEPSMEISPERITREYIETIADAGIKRLSMGVQSLRKELRRDMGRGRNLDLSELITAARDNSLNINIDVINGIRGQNNDDFMSTLKEILKFEPETISTYILSGVDNGLFKRDERIMTSSEKYDLFSEYYDYLTHHGYDCESHVKFIKKEQHSTHQQKIYEYEGTSTLGIGCGARSYNDFVHYSTPWVTDKKESNRLIDEYIEKDFKDLQWTGFYMNEDEIKRRSIIYAFFMGTLDFNTYQEKFGTEFKTDFPDEYEALLDNALVVESSSVLTLNEKGRKYTDLIGVMFWSASISAMFNARRLPTETQDTNNIIEIQSL